MAFELLAAGKANGDFSALTSDSGHTFSGDVTGLYIENGEIRGNAAAAGEKIQVVGYTTSSDTNQAYELTYRKDSNVVSLMWWLFGGADLTDCYGVRVRIESDGNSTFNLWRLASGGNTLLESSVNNSTGTGNDYVIRINHTAAGVEVKRDGSQVLSSNDTTYSPDGKVIGFRVDDTWAANTGLQVQRLWQEVVDTEAPVITVPGPNPLNLAIGDTYTEPTATWVDNVDGSGNVTNIGGDTVDTNTVGIYNVTYDYTDNQGNAATQVVLVVEVFEPVNIPKTYTTGVYPIEITATALNGTTQVINSTMTVEQPEPPVMPADSSGNINEGITAAGTYAATSGTAPITYTLSGADAGSLSINSSTAVVTFNTAPDFETKTTYAFTVTATNGEGSDAQNVVLNIQNVVEIAPVINSGSSSLEYVREAASYSDPSWTWDDDVVSAQSGTWSGDTVDTNTPGVYSRTFSATNAIGTTQESYTVIVIAAANVMSAYRSAVSGKVDTRYVFGNDPGNVPAVPGTPTVSYLSDTSLRVNWVDNSNDETGFEIQRSLDGATGWTTIATTAADVTSYDDTGLTVDTQYYYRVRAVNANGESAWSNVASGTTTVPSGTSDYPLEIIQPRAGLTTENRFYKQYPGIEYNVRLGVIGGVYKTFVFSLPTAPSGMTIDSATGEITWPNPVTSGSPHAVTARVVDSEGTQQEVSWTVTVTTSGFKFIDSVSGNDSNDGSLGSPWASMSKISDSSAGDFLYFRTGSYSSPAGSNSLDGDTESLVWMAYPGETPNFNFAAGDYFISNGTNRIYIDGLTIDVNNNSQERAFSYVGGEHNVTFRRNTFSNITGGVGNNPAFVYASKGGRQGDYAVFQDNNCSNGTTDGYAYLAYTNKNVLIEDNVVDNMPYAFSPKDGNGLWYIRGNTTTNISVNSIALQGFDSDGYGRGPQVYEYNNLQNNSGTNCISMAGWIQAGAPVYIRRNTVRGDIYNFIDDAGDGPFTYSKNVIINERSGLTDRIRHDNGEFGTVIYDDNVTGGAADGIVDASGNLQGSYRTAYLGTHGHEVS